jgi:tRNA pseudouridine55 synthase
VWVALDGIILVDKDEGMTSFEVVQKVKNRLGAQKAGHAGTLDKAASGLLIVCINLATSVQNILMSNPKRYRATVQLGAETDTLDRYGNITKRKKVGAVSTSEIERVLKRYTGEILQRPPLFSAIHHNGERLYRKALKGEKPPVNPRKVIINELKLIDRGSTELTIEVYASKGTYVRSLARDIAYDLGTCGYLSALRRIEVGPFSLSDAVQLSDVSGSGAIIPLANALEYLPWVEVEDEQALMVLNGVPVRKVLTSVDIRFGSERFFRVISHKRLLAIIEKSDSIRYFRVFKDFEVVYH